jgi:hypothetical protein
MDARELEKDPLVSYTSDTLPIRTHLPERLSPATMHPIHRAVYRAQTLPGQEAAATTALHARAAALPLGTGSGDLLTLSLFRLGRHLFAYWESVGTPVSPETLFDSMHDTLMPWPGRDAPRIFVPMTDIFHWQTPANLNHWRRKAPVERISGRLARLNPELASSYIFYHYQLQEERPGSVEKYGMISLHEELIFFYQEYPATVEAPAVPGKLATANTPDGWQEVMFPHFHLWDDTVPPEHIWRTLDLVLHRSVPSEQADG